MISNYFTYMIIPCSVKIGEREILWRGFGAKIKVADEAWDVPPYSIENMPNSFTSQLRRSSSARHANEQAKLCGRRVYVHIVRRSVPNRPPNPGRYRILFETAPGTRRISQ